MKEYREQEPLDDEEFFLSERQRHSLRAMLAPAGLGARIQQRLVGLRPAMTPIGLRQLSAAGLLGFLSFFGAQVLVSQLSPAPITSNRPAVSASKSVSSADSVTQYHLSGVVLLENSNYYTDTLDSPESSPEIALAAYLHQRGDKNE